MFSVRAETGTGSNGQVVRYYKCLGRKRGSDCKKSMIRKETLENFVIDCIVKELSKPDVIKRMVRGLSEAQETLVKDKSCENALLKEKRHTQRVIDNIMSAIEQGVVTNTTTKRLKELELKLEDLERKIVTERSKTRILLSEREIREYYEQALRLEPQMLINFLIKQIVLFDDKIEIYFNSPLRVSPDDSQGFSFASETGIMPCMIHNRKEPVLRPIRIELRL